MKTFSIKAAFKDGWELWKQHKKTITIATIIMMIFWLVSDQGNRGFSIFVFVISLVSLFIDMGWLKMLLKATHGEIPQVKDLTAHAKMIWKYVGVSIVTLLIVIGGLILLIVPGIYWGLKYLFAPVLVLDKNMSIKESLQKSGEMTDGIKLKLWGFIILVALASAAGIIALGVGLLVTIPVSTLAFLSVYKKLSTPEIITESVPEIAPETGPEIALS